MDRKPIKIKTYNRGYTALKPGLDGYYPKEGKLLRGVRSLLNYVQSMRDTPLDISAIPDPSLKSKLEKIIKGDETVSDKDWKAYENVKKLARKSYTAVNEL